MSKRKKSDSLEAITRTAARITRARSRPPRAELAEPGSVVTIAADARLRGKPWLKRGSVLKIAGVTTNHGRRFYTLKTSDGERFHLSPESVTIRRRASAKV